MEKGVQGWRCVPKLSSIAGQHSPSLKVGLDQGVDHRIALLTEGQASFPLHGQKVLEHTIDEIRTHTNISALLDVEARIVTLDDIKDRAEKQTVLPQKSVQLRAKRSRMASLPTQAQTLIMAMDSGSWVWVA